MPERGPLKAVVDTNLFVSGAISKRGLPAQMLDLWRRRLFLVVATAALTAEVVEVLNRPRIKQRYHLTDEDLAEIHALLATVAVTVTPQDPLPVDVRDPKDRKVLAAALGGEADYLITGDDDLLTLGGNPRLGRLRVVTVREFLGLLSAAHS